MRRQNIEDLIVSLMALAVGILIGWMASVW